MLPLRPVAVKSSIGKRKYSTEAKHRFKLQRGCHLHLQGRTTAFVLRLPVPRYLASTAVKLKGLPSTWQLAKGFVPASADDTCRQSHCPAERANQTDACTTLTSSSPSAIGSPIKQNGEDGSQTSWDRNAFISPLRYLYFKSSIGKRCSTKPPLQTPAWLPFLVRLWWSLHLQGRTAAFVLRLPAPRYLASTRVKLKGLPSNWLKALMPVALLTPVVSYTQQWAVRIRPSMHKVVIKKLALCNRFADQAE